MQQLLLTGLLLDPKSLEMEPMGVACRDLSNGITEFICRAEGQTRNLQTESRAQEVHIIWTHGDK